MTLQPMLVLRVNGTGGCALAVEHSCRVLKRQFGFTKVRYRGLARNTVRVVALFVLSNLWMARRPLLGAQA